MYRQLQWGVGGPLRRKLALFEPQFTPFVEEVGTTGSEIDNLGATVAVLLQSRTLGAVVSVGYPWRATDDAPAAVGTKVAFVANADEGFGSDVGVADRTLSVALLAETADGNTGLPTAHYQIGVMLRHGEGGAGGAVD